MGTQHRDCGEGLLLAQDRSGGGRGYASFAYRACFWTASRLQLRQRRLNAGKGRRNPAHSPTGSCEKLPQDLRRVGPHSI
jgi:hypothetical protein